MSLRLIKSVKEVRQNEGEALYLPAGPDMYAVNRYSALYCLNTADLRLRAAKRRTPMAMDAATYFADRKIARAMRKEIRQEALSAVLWAVRAQIALRLGYLA